MRAYQFWRKVKKLQSCWLWTGSKNSDGYGIVDRTKLAHRISWMLCKGSIPNGFCVLHSCDNPSCVNPGHLRLGTHKDNARDRVERGRGCSIRGEAHWKAKLSDKQVLEIRALYKDGGETYASIGSKFGVSGDYVGCLIRGQFRA